MHDRFPLRSVLLMLLPAAVLLMVGWTLWGGLIRDALFAVLKLVVMA